MEPNTYHDAKVKCIERISTGSKSLDDILGGGIETKAVTEFYGETGSGKTQVCHTLCVMAAQDESEDSVASKAIYIDSQGKFRPERIASIATSRGFIANQILSNIVCKRTMTAPQQESIIETVQSLMDKYDSIKLLIIDSVISNYRSEFSRLNLSERQKKLYKFMCSLSSVAQSYNIAIVVTNQVNFSGHLGTARTSGGSIMARASNYRVSLKRLRNKIAAKIVSSPYHPENGTYMMINEKGIDDIPQ
jgi:DNA repair protein RadA